MGTRYNGLLDTERFAVLALQQHMELMALKYPDKVLTPESELREVINNAGLSSKDILDQNKVLRAYYGRR